MLKDQSIKKSLSIRQLYKETRHIIDNGIEGYNIIKKYEDPTAILRSKQDQKHKRKIKELKRGSYLDDEIYQKKDIPGVCKYDILQKQLPKNNKKRHESEKKTYLAQAMQTSKKNNVPAPGYYNALQAIGQKTLTSSTFDKKYENSSQKILKAPKINYLDSAQYEGSITPGVGEYTISRSNRSKSEHAKGASKSPEYWRQHHQQSQKKLQKNEANATPSVGSYNPNPLQYQLFCQKKKLPRLQSQLKVSRQKPGRFRTETIAMIQSSNKKANIGPGKYDLINQWVPKEKNKKGILSIISKATPVSVYYH